MEIRFRRCWTAWDVAVKAAEDMAEGSVILDIGPGAFPFKKATVGVGRQHAGVEYDMEFIPVEFTEGKLPFDDKSVDFVYCRHTVEDLNEPTNLLREIQRVAKSGWIETPSPLSELCRNVEVDAFRGYHHHRSVVWSDGRTLFVAPKWPTVDLLEYCMSETEMLLMLNEGPLQWNTYHFWKDSDLDFKCLQNEIDFNNSDISYNEILNLAIKSTIEHNNRCFQLSPAGVPS